MFTLVRPDPARIARLRAQQSTLAHSYPVVGSTRGETPTGFRRDHHTVVLGSGDAVWARATAAVRAWRMFDLGWVELHDSDAPIAVGTTVAILIRSMGLWSLNAARIVYVHDEPERFGFAYGTLPEHAESGEERFVVRRNDAGLVTYELTADSRPQQLLAQFAHPWVRHLQKRFAVDSLRAMQRATANTP
ncbi:MAG: DUF1990 domain-containing protein [Planctomycetes bacterium]|nr:DUF1990 domain-containing protein [Planctomycetota bacterium]